MLFRELQSKALRLRKAVRAKINRAAGGRDLYGRRIPPLTPSIERGCRLGIVCIVKNESAYIGEWLQFHILQGATDFFIYDNGSTDDTLEVARKYSAGANCTIIPWRTFAIADEHPFSIQSLAYGHALCNFGPHLRRMAFIDIDEFLFSPSGAQLPAVLNELEHLPSIAVPWLNFGPNGHQTRPQGLVIENYTECAPHPLLAGQRSLLRYKSIVDPLQVAAMASHIFPLREHGSVAINEKGRMIEQYNVTDTSFVVTEKLRLNHYFTRSLAEIQTRIAKGRVSHNGTVVENYIERRLNAYSQQTARDETILQFVPELRKRMELVGQH
ncbi:MAG TPA: glycosyltransferase family 92 protein [Hyphomicrobium sp.]|nr:glycosyltransferase family 92 protein [Hyphomicrobium sp.]